MAKRWVRIDDGPSSGTVLIVGCIAVYAAFKLMLITAAFALAGAVIRGLRRGTLTGAGLIGYAVAFGFVVYALRT